MDKKTDIKMVGDSGVKELTQPLSSGLVNPDPPDALARIADDVLHIRLLFLELLALHGCIEKRQDQQPSLHHHQSS